LRWPRCPSGPDLGCGAGYFALKLSWLVGPQGRVLAEDIRGLPLLFLRLRALLLNQHNVTIVRGEPDDPHLPAEGVDATLVANTYHELTDTGPILDHVFRALRPGGRLVVVDPSPEDASERAAHHHETAAAEATSPGGVRDHAPRRSFHRAFGRRRVVAGRGAKALSERMVPLRRTPSYVFVPTVS